MNEIDPQALFRSSVLGPLISRQRLARGELQKSLRELATREYVIPGTDRRLLGEKTIEGWYYRYRARGLDGLIPKVRADRGQSKLSASVQAGILALARDRRHRRAGHPVALESPPPAPATRSVAAPRLGEPAREETQLRRRLRR